MSILDTIFLTLQHCFSILFDLLTFQDTHYNITFNVVNILVGGFVFGVLLLLISTLFSIRFSSKPDREDKNIKG